mgnify:CR=1 FL=1
MLSGIELAILRSDVQRCLDQTCEVRRPSPSRTSMGGTAYSDAVIGTHPCRVAPARSPERFIAAQKLSGAQAWWVTLPYDVVVQPGDRLIVGTVTLVVLGTFSSESFRIATRVLCEEATA